MCGQGVGNSTGITIAISARAGNVISLECATKAS